MPADRTARVARRPSPLKSNRARHVRTGLPGRRWLSLREGLSRLCRENLERSVHPARTKNDRVRQVSWLAGQCRTGRLLRTVKSQWRDGRSARRLQLQGQPGVRTPFPFDPLSRNLSRGGQISPVLSSRKRESLPNRAILLIRAAVTGARKGLIGKFGRRESAVSVTAPATVTGERVATRPLGFFPRRRRRRDDPGSQETGPLSSFFRAGGMYRADEGLPLADDMCAFVAEGGLR